MSQAICYRCKQLLRPGRLLDAVEFSLPWEVIRNLGQCDLDDVIDERHIYHRSGDASDEVAFTVKLRCSKSFIYLRLLNEGPNLFKDIVQVDCRFVRKGAGALPIDRSKWPASRRLVQNWCGRCLKEGPSKGSVGLSLAAMVSFRARLKLFAIRAESVCSVPARLQESRLDGVLCDIVLVAEGKEFPAHKVVLSAGSAVFHKMFAGCYEFKEVTEGRVEMKGVSALALERFLQYLYVEELDDWGNCELELLGLAEQYMVDRLKTDCRLRMWEMDGPRALKVLLRGDTVAGSMAWRLMRLVAADWSIVAAMPEWAELQKNNAFIAEIISSVASGDTFVTTFK